MAKSAIAYGFMIDSPPAAHVPLNNLQYTLIEMLCPVVAVRRAPCSGGRCKYARQAGPKAAVLQTAGGTGGVGAAIGTSDTAPTKEGGQR